MKTEPTMSNEVRTAFPDMADCTTASKVSRALRRLVDSPYLRGCDMDSEAYRALSEYWDGIKPNVGSYQGHKFGPATATDGKYLDVIMPHMQWVVMDVRGGLPIWPVRNTWRAAYGLMRRMQGLTSR